MYIFLFLVQLCSCLALAWGGRIVGGEEAGLTDAPWQVIMLGGAAFNHLYWCSSTSSQFH